MRRTVIFNQGLEIKNTLGFRKATTKDLKLVKDAPYMVLGRIKEREELVLIDDNGNFIVIDTVGLLKENLIRFDAEINGIEVVFSGEEDILTWYVRAESFEKKEEKKDMTLVNKIREKVEEMRKEGKVSGTIAVAGVSQEEIQEALAELSKSGIVGKSIKLRESDSIEDVLKNVCDCENCTCEEEINDSEAGLCDCENCDITECPDHPNVSPEVKLESQTLDVLSNFAEVILDTVDSSIVKADLLALVNDSMRIVSDKLDENIHDMISRDELETVSDAFETLCDELEDLGHDIERDLLGDQLDVIADYLTDIEEAKDEAELEEIEEEENKAEIIKEDIGKMIDVLPEEALDRLMSVLRSFNN